MSVDYQKDGVRIGLLAVGPIRRSEEVICRCGHGPHDHSMLSPGPCSRCKCEGWRK